MHTRFAQLTIAGGFVASIGLVAPSFTARPAAQEPAAQAPDAQTPGDRPTFRGGTRLATFDAVVTDDKGRHVTGLTPDDFEVVERGKRQTVRHVVYVNVAGTEAASGSPGIAMPGRPGALRENTGRVLAIVIDDLRMSFPSIVYTRHVLNEYLDRHFRPGDVVAIIRTLGGGGTLQQFTTDRRLLKAAIERIRWSPREWPSFDPGGPVGYGPRPAERLEREFTLDGSLGALEYVVRGVQALPGRKTVVFVSHGFSLDGPGWYGSGIRSDVERVIDTANRGGVVLYTLDPTGLRSASLTAADGPFAASRRSSGLGDVGESSVAMAQSLAAATQVRLRANQEQQYSLEYLARETGGFAVVGNNNLTGGLARIMTDTRGYYLIGFDTALTPGVSTERGAVRIRVTRKGLEVRARRDRFGPADPDAPPLERTADPLSTALKSPFATGQLDVRVETLFGHDEADGSVVHAVVSVDPAGLTLTEAQGERTGHLMLVVFALDHEGHPVVRTHQPVDVRLDDAAWRRAQARGLRYDVQLPFKDAGGYQVRAAIVDEPSRRIGAGSQYVEVPRIGKGRVALSSVVLSDAGDPGRSLTTAFAHGGRLEYAGTVYDGRTDRTRGFSATATVLRDGKPVVEAAPVSIAPAAGASPVAPVAFRGSLQLGADVKPGVYTLQVALLPDDVNAKKPRAVQWADFEVR